MSQIFKEESNEENLNELLDSKFLEDDNLLGDMIEDSPLLSNVEPQLQSSNTKGEKETILLGVAEREGFDDNGGKAKEDDKDLSMN